MVTQEHQFFSIPCTYSYFYLGGGLLKRKKNNHFLCIYPYRIGKRFLGQIKNEVHNIQDIRPDKNEPSGLRIAFLFSPHLCIESLSSLNIDP